MKLVGMMDSPYVRRVAVTLRLLGIAHEHESVSVFRHMDRFRAINPLVKAPTLVWDDGTVLTDSSLILDAIEHAHGRSLWPADPGERRAALRLAGIGLTAMDKAVQRYYELSLRPQEKRHEPWLERVSAQMHVAWGLLDAAAPADGWLLGGGLTQADVTAAVAWTFTNFVLPGTLEAGRYPRAAAHAARTEALPEFVACPLE